MKRAEIGTLRSRAFEMFAAGHTKREIAAALCCSVGWLGTFLPTLTHKERTERNRQSAKKRHDRRDVPETPEERRKRVNEISRNKRRYEIAKVARWLSRGKQ